MASQVEVTYEDQVNINTFNKLNTKKTTIQAKLKAKERQVEDFEDASNELMLDDEEQVRFLQGASFVHLAHDEAEEKLQEESDRIQAEIKALKEELQSVFEAMESLKKVLYSKFGESINLEE